MKNDILNTRKLGYKFYFQDGDNQIACFGSYFTGKEEVYVNDELISNKRNQRIHSGKLECSLYKNGQFIKSYEQSSLLNNPKTSLKVLFGCFFGGLVGGYLLIIILEFLIGKL